MTVKGTRELLLAAGERLIAEHGVTAVSARRIAEEAGAANHSAVAYHFGTKLDLILEIIRTHGARTDAIGREMIEKAADSPDPREHLACVLLPTLVHLDRLGPPTYYARFVTQVLSDPSVETRALPELAGSHLGDAMRAVARTLPDLPPEVMRMRWRLVRPLLFRASASFELDLAEGRKTYGTWEYLGLFMLDAIGGLLFAPNTLPPEAIRNPDTPEWALSET
ncbi:TetR family transcriptional regulator [Actinocorallia herbida]|uniref:TetR family transcriptional regulator n=1 Tax=Actinocorallia herbida TaxID=58109 RepID=A0A3N1CV11_9ACTN|nr:helix-turn-helix domain-containing protein [Actinocorallia herbida]ROO84538.1 TetR family transcriptional regulator [Actinocorallia herbida]